VSYVKYKLKEDAPTNCASGGQIAGMGVGPQGEPGVPKRKLIPRIKKILSLKKHIAIQKNL